MFKGVIIDVDGVIKPYTLQGLPEPIDQDAIEGIKLIEESGLKVCYASGKKASYVNGCIICSGLNGNSFIAGENGGIIINGCEPIMKYSEHLEAIESLRKELPIAVNKWSCFKKDSLQGWMMEEEKDASLTILLSGLDPISFSKYLEDMIKAMGIELVVIPGPSYVDVIQKGADKSYALGIFSNETGIAPEDMVGIGDEKNDIPMLKLVGFPAAPANAISEVKGIVQGRGGYLASKPVGKGFLEICKYIIKL